ncbi:MAG: Cob(I)alamin adenosyltransferase [Marinimicrobia bacterium 46_47]|nr:MAG: Cob(I)alamin adenosyltransferase [Marinimicrobia bacterium 46_47]KUK92174.1 MAG: Cob(I)alamin adenosyltransferase [Marinimicrobia bacterium 46_43]HBY17542.1 cob(I)yrinic acid a,c-diamide adenosyltransferase [Candidatus Neomarinimicrobiota bacterium]
MKESKGLVLVYTGNGKGKTTAAMGTALRCLGYGCKVCMVQFIKGDWHYGELDAVKRLAPDFEIHRMGKGFYHIMDDKIPEKEHREAAERALAFAREKMLSGAYRLIILDEILVSIRVNLIPEKQLLDFIQDKPEAIDLILTGRGAGEAVIQVADLVTEMKEIKHPYQKGIPGKRGIDF